MNKTALKNFAVWARKKLIADITYKAGLIGISEKQVKTALPQSAGDVEFYDIGTKEPYAVSGEAVKQRRHLVDLIHQKATSSDYQTAFHSVVEEAAYTWFNRVIAVRFMEVNDYLPSHIRVLSSYSSDKLEPDLVTTPFDAELGLTEAEKAEVIRLKNENLADDLFRMLFIRQCNALNGLLPKLFEKTADYSELLLNISVTDQDGVVYHLVHDIEEDDFNVEKGGQVEIIGWLYQYYNTEPKDETFALLKKNVKITKERIPSATQLFTPDWIVRYMVENSLGRLWLEGHPNDEMKSGWKYYLDEAKQEPEVQAQLDKIREEYKTIKPEDIKVIDPCMGSGHILVYAFDVLMQIYETAGYSRRDAAKSILEHNLYGLDIDDRAFQLAYFAVMMKARQYNRRILNGETVCHVYSIQESNGFNSDYLKLLGNDDLTDTAEKLIDVFTDAKEYGSILNVDIPLPKLEALQKRIDEISKAHYDNFFDSARQSGIVTLLAPLLQQVVVMEQKYNVVVTNPPYMAVNNASSTLGNYIKRQYADEKSDLYSVFIKKCIQFCINQGFVSMVTMQTWMFLASFQKLREYLLSKTMYSLVQIGYNSFPELNSKVAQAVSFTLSPWKIGEYFGKYLDLSDKYSQSADKDAAFAKEAEAGFYIRKTEQFSNVEGSPFAYWMSSVMFDLFKKKKMNDYSEARIGLATGNNDYYLRLWFEVSNEKIGYKMTRNEAKALGKKWFPYNKGGEFRKWYGNRDYVINWENDGHELQTRLTPDGKRIWAHNFNLDYIFKPQIAWSYITTSELAFRVYGKGFIFDSAGTAAFTSKDKFFYILAYMNSVVANRIANYLDPTMHFTPGEYGSVPYIDIENKEIENLAKECVGLCSADWDSFETSWNFECHPLVQLCHGADAEDGHEIAFIEDAYNEWQFDCEQRFNELKSNEEELNHIFIDIYGLHDELTPEVKDKDVTVARIYDTKEVIPESMKGNNYVLTQCDVIKSFLSYAVGCMFGRYSLDNPGLAYAGGEWDGSKYGSFIPDKDNILPITDEAYFEDDIIGRFVEFVKAVYGAETLEENLDFITKALSSKGNTSREIIRNYFLNDFFKDHCATYSVTGSGKRPIYWLFDSGKQNGFKALIYMHRYDENTIGNLRVDYLHRMERIYESEIVRMQDMIDNSANAREVTAATKRKEKLQKQIKECKEYDEKIAHLALARITIDLDDGVKVNYEKVQTDTDNKFYQVLAKI